MTRSSHAPLLTLLFFVAATPLFAQQHRVAAPEKVVRAIGVYEWTGDLAKPTGSRFLPIALFIDGQMQDAGVYMTRPVPFAIQPGNVYSLDQAGISRGTLDITSAARFADSGVFDSPWYAGGRIVPAPVVKTPVLRASKTLPVIVATGIKNPADSGRPTLINKSPDASSKPASTGNTTAKSSDDSRPTLINKSPDANGSPDASTKPASTDTSTQPASTPTSTTTKPSPTGSSNDDADRPTLRRRTADEQKEAANEPPVANPKDKKGRPLSSVSGPTTPLNADPDRPTLHRGNAGTGADDEKILSGFPPGLQQMVGVSDAADRSAHDFARPWDDDNEKTAITAKLEAMAREQLSIYEKANPLPAGADTTTIAHVATASVTTPTPTNIAPADGGPPKLQRGIPKDDTTTQTATAPAAPSTTNSGAPSSASSGTSQTTTKAGSKTTTPTKPLTPAQRRAAAAAKTAATPPPPEALPTPLIDEQVRGYTLSYGGDPVFVFTAHTAGTGAAQRIVTLVAAEDPLNNNDLHLAIHSVTDAFHLDRTADLRLIDAVDPDASNRADLLFELRYQNSRQFGLYRILSGRSTQVFLSGTTR